jgi:4-hydroxy-tetrahydrodipicolinate reductase
MGQVITQLAAQSEDFVIVAGVDVTEPQDAKIPFFTDIAQCNISCDCVVDYSSPVATEGLLAYCDKHQLPCVLCTTGLSDEQIQKVNAIASHIPILRSANMSLGINLLLSIVKSVSRTLVPAGFDVEIVEKHHHLKKDAPSGTALALAESVNEEFDHQLQVVTDRSQNKDIRDTKEIGISSVRAGSIVGEHDVIFAGIDEVITLSHAAYSKAVFGKGTLEAARFIVGKPAGLYTMQDVVSKKSDSDVF